MAENLPNPHPGQHSAPESSNVSTHTPTPVPPSAPNVRPASRLLRPTPIPIQPQAPQSQAPVPPSQASQAPVSPSQPPVPPSVPLMQDPGTQTDAFSSPNSSDAPSETAENVGGPESENSSGMQSPEDENASSADYLEYLQALKARLSYDSAALGRRFLVLIPVFLLGLSLLFFVLGLLHHYMVGRYAVLEAVSVTQNAGNQGQLEIAFRVVSPGLVHLRRTSGGQTTDLLYEYERSCDEKQQWSWNYVPGQPIDLTLWSRSGIRRTFENFSFPTSNIADIVILMDTTESMDASINALKEKCLDFAIQLERQAVKPRFSLIGFGDAALGRAWVSETEFTEDSLDFLQAVTSVPRFEGGDLPESSLDALRLAIEKVKKNSQGHAIRFYLVTDQKFHPQTADGKDTTASIAKALKENRIMLDVFCHQRFRADFEVLVGDCGRVREIENFGEVLSQGRFLED